VTGRDVVVIGAGIVGACIADELSSRGARVRVLEASAAPATGSTGRSFAGVRGQWPDRTNALLAWHSMERYRSRAEEAGYRPIGYLLLVPPADWEDALAAVALQRSLGIPVEVLTTDEAQGLVGFDQTGLAGCTWGPADGVVDPHQITMAALGRARARGADVQLSAAVTGLSQVGERWSVQVGDRRVEADVVVNAAGGWSGQVAALAGLDVPVQHVRRTVFGTAPGAGLGQVPMVIDTPTGFYLRGEGDRLLFARSDPAQPPGYDTSVPWHWLEPTLAVGSTRFPWLADTPIDSSVSWAGTYDTAPDSQAVLGRMPEARGFVNACGFSGHGVMQAAAVGEVIAEEVLDGRAHTIDIDPLRIERFSDATDRLQMVF
jgi:sarcosine oxidase subunit beta